MCVLQVLGKVKQPTKFQHRSSMLHADYANMYLPEAFHYMYPKMFFGGFEGKDVKMLCSTPPPKGTTLHEYASVGVSFVKIGSTA